MIKLIVVGHSAINRTHTQKGKGSYFGGAGYHVAWAAAQFLPKLSVRLISSCGRDFDLSALRRSGVDVKSVIIDQNVDSDLFIIREENKERSFEVEGKLWSKVSIENLSKDMLNASYLHLATAPPAQQLKWLRQARRLFGDKIAVSSDSFELFVRQAPDEVKEIFNSSQLIFANEEEWRELKEDFKTPLVLKRGRGGSAYFSGGRKVFETKAPRVEKVVDTTGAGEIVAGVFLAMRLCGFSERKSLRVACKIASWSVNDFGIEHLLAKQKFVRLVQSVKKQKSVV